MHRQVPPWESIKETFDLGFRGWLQLSCRTCSAKKRFVGRMQTIAIERAAEVIRRGHEQLPQHFRLPRRQRLRVHGMNVRVRQQAQSLQSFLRAHGLRKRRNRRWIKYVAPLHCGGHVQMVFDQEMDLRLFFGRKLQPVRGRFQRLQATRYVILAPACPCQRRAAKGKGSTGRGDRRFAKAR